MKADRMFLTRVEDKKVDPRKRVHSFAEVARTLKPGEEATVTVLSAKGDCFPDGILVCFRQVGVNVETPDQYWVSRPQMDV